MKREEFRSNYRKQNTADWEDCLTHRIPSLSREQVNDVAAYICGIIDSVIQDAQNENCTDNVDAVDAEKYRACAARSQSQWPDGRCCLNGITLNEAELGALVRKMPVAHQLRRWHPDGEWQVLNSEDGLVSVSAPYSTPEEALSAAFGDKRAETR